MTVKHLNASNRYLLAYALLGGALAWFLHLMVTYAVGEFACVLDARTAAYWLFGTVTVIALAAAAGATAVSWKLRKGPSDWIGRAGLISNIISLAVILAQTLPIFYLMESC